MLLFALKVVLLLLMYCLCIVYVPPIVCGGSVLVFVWYALLYVHSSVAIIFAMKRELVDLLLLS